MPVLTGLEGTKEDKEVVFIDNPRRAVKFLLRGYAVTASGDNGALNVWNDDAGKYRCKSMRFLATKEPLAKFIKIAGYSGPFGV